MTHLSCVGWTIEQLESFLMGTAEQIKNLLQDFEKAIKVFPARSFLSDFETQKLKAVLAALVSKYLEPP